MVNKKDDQIHAFKYLTLIFFLLHWIWYAV